METFNCGHFVVEGNVARSSDGAERCRICKNRQSRESSQRNPETAYRSRASHQLRKRYGITSLEERDALLASQGNACDICGRRGLVWGKGYNDVWHVDHEHGKEGTHRGILCATCNLALGKLEPYMEKVLAYLAKHRGSN